MQCIVILLCALTATAPAAAATTQAAVHRGAATEVAAKRLTFDQIAKASRPSHPRKVISGKRQLR